MRIIAPASALILALLPVPSFAQQGDGTKESFSVSVVKPQKLEATQARIDGLNVADGFKIAPFATGLKNIRIIAVSDAGHIYVTRRDQGDILLLKDEDDDGKADGEAKIVADRPGAHGIAITGNQLYLVTVKELFVANIAADGSLGDFKLLLGDLPDSGQHPNRTLAVGPDGMIYLSVGSTCNACNESNPESATMLRIAPDGKSRIIFASGLRNTIGFAWHPKTGEFWGFDHGIDYLGDDVQPEELNKLEVGKQYGWPHIWGKDGLNPQSTPVGQITKEEWKAMSVPMMLGYTAHAAPMQMVFSDTHSAFPAAYDGDAFVAMRGSWNRTTPSGHEIVHVKFKDGVPTKIEPFVTGFATKEGHFARPVGLAFAKDGSLLMADDANGVLYRITSSDAKKPAAATAAPADEMKVQAQKGVGVKLANERDETANAKGKIEITSPAFTEGAPLAQRFSEYYDGVSPALTWTAVDGAKSYVLVLEDPDAKPITPFIHWVAFNIPASVTTLPEGLQEQLQLTKPEGVRQGKTSRGSPGYYGPRPPVGDKPHRYVFQLLALNATLDLLPGADRDAVLKAAAPHVIAKGELTGTYGQQDKPLK